MKFTYIRVLSLALLFIALAANAQSVKLKKADRYYELFKFEKAIDQYKRVIEKDPGNAKAIERLGDCYRLLGNPAEAEFWYSEAVKKEGVDPKVAYYYAQALRDNGKYEQAKEYYASYAEKAPDDPRGSNLAEAMDEVAELKADSMRYRVWNLDSLNTPAYEFSPAFYKDDNLAIVSNRGKSRKKDVWTGGQALLNLYLVQFGDSNKVTVSDMPGKVNTRYHEGPLVFNKDFSKVYFTRNALVNGRKKESEEDILKLNVFSAELDGDKWKNVEVLPFNSTEYTCGHPALSPDGKTLYFSSDMPGGYGGLDLWKVEADSAGWGEPINLGDVVNSQGDEQFPFVHSDGTLYFAANAYAGLGGLDIYEAKETNGKWGSVTNMGYPINTNADDFGLIFNKEKTGGYFSSNRSSGHGEDDIYQFDNQALTIKGIVYDRITGDPIGGATVHIIKENDTLGVQTTDSLGRFKFQAESGLTYLLPAFKEGFAPNKLSINTADMTNASPPVRIPLDRGELMLVGTTFEVKVNDTSLEEERIGTLDAVKVRLYNETDGTIDSVMSDADGNFRFALKPEKSYRLEGDKDFYFLKSELTFSTAEMTGGTVEAELELYKIAGVIRLVNIYYDFDKYNIRPDAAKELDRVYDILYKYPDLVIQMRSHTDCRGSRHYNMLLSANRAQSAANYIIKKGMDNNVDMLPSITAAGFGETLPIYADLCETEQGVRDSELSKDLVDKHQMNRRTEFIVIQQPKGIRVQGSVQQ